MKGIHVTDEKIEQLGDLLDQGLPFSEIALAMQVSADTIARWCNKYHAAKTRNNYQDKNAYRIAAAEFAGKIENIFGIPEKRTYQFIIQNKPKK